MKESFEFAVLYYHNTFETGHTCYLVGDVNTEYKSPPLTLLSQLSAEGWIIRHVNETEIATTNLYMTVWLQRRIE